MIIGIICIALSAMMLFWYYFLKCDVYFKNCVETVGKVLRVNKDSKTNCISYEIQIDVGKDVYRRYTPQYSSNVVYNVGDNVDISYVKFTVWKCDVFSVRLRDKDLKKMESYIHFIVLAIVFFIIGLFCIIF